MAGAVRSHESLGARLHRLRTDRGLTQKDLAGERYTAAYISTVEAERRTPSTDALSYFAERLGVTPAELSTGRPSELPADLLIALAEAELSGELERFRRVRTLAADAGLRRAEAAALTGLGRIPEAEALLAGEPLTVRVPLLIAKARLIPARDAAYLLDGAVAQLESSGLPDPEAEAALRYALVEIYADLGYPERAVSSAEAAEALTGPPVDSSALIERHLTTARTLREQSHWADAEAAAERARLAIRHRGYRRAAALGRWSRGRLLVQRGEAEAALAELTVAREVLGEIVAGELAEVLWQLGRAADALDAAAEAEPATAYKIQGLIARERGDLATAEELLRAALEAASGLAACAIARELGDILRASGQELAAIEVYRRGLAEIETGRA
ncbi:helix-turn-helix domain-containing protein [Longispora albida]|uniref:helix-turn-helix domain-containing protein n=1 Tax=Longispora albida TaxID=203523 RepID=UPI00037B1C49|nr:helix-turn-helix transcriptional regulator [Longispora albida]